MLFGDITHCVIRVCVALMTAPMNRLNFAVALEALQQLRLPLSRSGSLFVAVRVCKSTIMRVRNTRDE